VETESVKADRARLFAQNRLVVLRRLLEEREVSLLYRYAAKAAHLGGMRSGDSQVPGASCSYGDPIMEGLLSKLLPTVDRASGLRLFPTYSYFRVYQTGDVLGRHTDRPSCEISLSLCLGYEGPAPWPIWIEGPRGAMRINLEPGDGLLYRGIECSHWRCPYEGSRLAQSFLHYVDQQGAYSQWKFDKRPSLTDIRSLKKSSGGPDGLL
jgi:hypothetical protein